MERKNKIYGQLHELLDGLEKYGDFPVGSKSLYNTILGQIAIDIRMSYRDFYISAAECDSLLMRVENLYRQHVLKEGDDE